MKCSLVGVQRLGSAQSQLQIAHTPMRETLPRDCLVDLPSARSSVRPLPLGPIMPPLRSTCLQRPYIWCLSVIGPWGGRCGMGIVGFAPASGYATEYGQIFRSVVSHTGRLRRLHSGAASCFKDSFIRPSAPRASLALSIKSRNGVADARDRRPKTTPSRVSERQNRSMLLTA